MTLTNKQRIFVEEYLKCWNATAAARAAGYSENTAAIIGHENLQKPNIAAEIDRRKAEIIMTTDEVLTRLGEQARGAHTAYIGADGSVDLAGLKAAGLMHLIKGTRYDRVGNLIVEFYDAQAALDKLLKTKGVYIERHELSGPGGGPIVVTKIEVIPPADNATAE